MNGQALGISIGDKVWTSYENAVYRVIRILGPRWWMDARYMSIIVWPYPVISLALEKWDNPNSNDGSYVINDIHQDGPRWFTDQGSEVFVEKHAAAYQPDLFDAIKQDDPHLSPYPFDSAVDYSTINRVFKCSKCRRDFNAEMRGIANPPCPLCGHWSTNRIIVMPAVDSGRRYWSWSQRDDGGAEEPEQPERNNA